MAETVQVRIYESDKELVEALTEDGPFPARLREIVTKAEAYENVGSDLL